MHRSQKVSRKSAHVTQPRLEAWAVSTPSTNRISPLNKKGISQLLKAASTLAHKSGFDVTKNPEDYEGIKPPEGNYTVRRRSSKILSTIKARLEKDSHVFRTKMRELEPAVRSMSLEQEQTGPRLKDSISPSERLKSAIPSVASTRKNLEKGQIGLLGAQSLEGEKLVTVGGYIISLQEVNKNITSIIRPRVSSDRSGLELEIKILGCNPLDIKFERRYDTLIVIGVSKSTIRKYEDTKSHALKDGKAAKESKDNMPFLKNQRTFDQEIKDAISYSYSDHELLEEMQELINIFVPRHAALNQVFVSKPDTKGRIFVKGP